MYDCNLIICNHDCNFYRNYWYAECDVIRDFDWWTNAFFVCCKSPHQCILISYTLYCHVRKKKNKYFICLHCTKWSACFCAINIYCSVFVFLFSPLHFRTAPRRIFISESDRYWWMILWWTRGCRVTGEESEFCVDFVLKS